MKNTLIVFVTMVLLIGCSKDDSQEGVDCITEKLEALEMVEYDDQAITCQFFLRLYEYNEKQYFLLDNYCADFTAYPTDCAGNQLCETEIDSECSGFYESATEIRIVGIAED